MNLDVSKNYKYLIEKMKENSLIARFILPILAISFVFAAMDFSLGVSAADEMCAAIESIQGPGLPRE